MKSWLNRRLAIALVALLALGGAGGAWAATQSSGGSSRQAYLNDVASHLGVTPTALTAAMKAAAIDRVNSEVTAGRLTQAQATRLKQRIEQGKGVPILGYRAGGGRRGVLVAAAQYLGLSPSSLRSELRSGKTLAQIASSTPGKSTGGLKAAILAAEKARLDKAVSNGRITSQQEQQRLTKRSSRLDSLLTRAWSSASAKH